MVDVVFDIVCVGLHNYDMYCHRVTTSNIAVQALFQQLGLNQQAIVLLSLMQRLSSKRRILAHLMRHGTIYQP